MGKPPPQGGRGDGRGDAAARGAGDDGNDDIVSGDRPRLTVGAAVLPRFGLLPGVQGLDQEIQDAAQVGAGGNGPGEDEADLERPRLVGILEIGQGPHRRIEARRRERRPRRLATGILPVLVGHAAVVPVPAGNNPGW